MKCITGELENEMKDRAKKQEQENTDDLEQIKPELGLEPCH